MENKTCIILCRCGASFVPNDKLDEISGLINKLDINVFELQDLCAVSVRESEIIRDIANNYSLKIVIACYPRAVKNMLIQAGISYEGFETINFKEFSGEQIFQKIKEKFNVKDGNAEYKVVKSTLSVPAWYPVIDDSLCILCGKCARFCLFGVYTYNGKSLKVIDPLACKNNCPACGRTCPVSAIIFPRLPEKTSLAGAEPDRERKADGGGLLVMLNERNRGRKSILKEGIMQLAEEERKRALEEIRHLSDQKKRHD
jgi:heterodisulfide reductase subunit A-like polyferredoxin